MQHQACLEYSMSVAQVWWGMVFSDADGDGIHDASEQTGFRQYHQPDHFDGNRRISQSLLQSSNALGRFFFSGAVLSNSAGYTATSCSNTERLLAHTLQLVGR